MKNPFIRLSLSLSMLLAASLDASEQDKHKPNHVDARSGKRAAVRTTRIRGKYSIQNRLYSHKDNTGGGFYSFRRHDYSARLFPRRKGK